MDSGYSSEKSASIISLDELLETAPCNKTIGDNLIRAWNIINNSKYKNICCSISGGSDSDIVLDICTKVDIQNKITYVFFDTGVESKATKEHIRYLEKRYGIEIKVYKAWEYGMTIPNSCKKYGQPFLSKQVSEWIERLQRHNFLWEDKTFDELLKEYPRCEAALKWWCNEWPKRKNRKESKFNIAYNKYLKEFMIINPPHFSISNKCCHYAKKLVAHTYKIDNKIDLSITGVRKSEGGARATAYKNCYSHGEDDIDEYRPVFWYTNDDKRCYEQHYGIVHSKCYSQYGLKRTGCVGCPFGRTLQQELEVFKVHEPQLHKAVCNVFKDSYEYTRQYRDFYKKMNEQSKEKDTYQMSIFDFIQS